MTEIMND